MSSRPLGSSFPLSLWTVGAAAKARREPWGNLNLGPWTWKRIIGAEIGAGCRQFCYALVKALRCWETNMESWSSWWGADGSKEVELVGSKCRWTRRPSRMWSIYEWGRGCSELERWRLNVAAMVIKSQHGILSGCWDCRTRQLRQLIEW